jgi:hypothetical protein
MNYLVSKPYPKRHLYGEEWEEAFDALAKSPCFREDCSRQGNRKQEGASHHQGVTLLARAPMGN